MVRHTLSAFCEHGDTDAKGEGENVKALQTLPNQHHQFASRWLPFKPQGGPLRVGSDEEACLRGRVCPEMLAAVLPPPNLGTYVVVSGPPQMWMDVSRMLRAAGH